MKATLGLRRLTGANGQRWPMHWLFWAQKSQVGTLRCIVTPSCSRVKSMAARIASQESRLQHRGPPTWPMASSARAVMRLLRPQGPAASGVERVTMAVYCPALTPAPQAPQNPQAPPGTARPRLAISRRAGSSSSSPPAFL